MTPLTRPDPDGGTAPKLGDEEERRVIRDAMDRLLAGSPIRSDGKLTIKSLAAEANVKRWLLTHKHKDLQDEFRSRQERQGDVPEAFKKTLDENAALKERLKRTGGELKQAKAELERYARVVQVLTLENADLQDQVKELSDTLAGSSPSGQPN